LLIRAEISARDLNEFNGAVDEVFDDYVTNVMTFMVRFAIKDDIHAFLEGYRYAPFTQRSEGRRTLLVA
jgi:hypothetical protein